MHGELKHEDVEAARRDLADRTLATIRGDLARLIYLASMRDYNTGEYHHEGLALRFTESVAGRAISSCHRDMFRRLVLCPVKELVKQLELYADSNCSTSSQLVRVWEKLQPYRVAVPLERQDLLDAGVDLDERARPQEWVERPVLQPDVAVHAMPDV